MRPRKDGPVYDIFMEFVGNKKRKVVAVHHWVNSAQGSSREAGVRRLGIPDSES
jgi:hypothetical protein